MPQDFTGDIIMLSLSCIPCITNQILRTLELMELNEEKKIILFKKAIKMLSDENWNYMPSIMYFKIYRFLRMSTGIYDPYHEIKKTWNIRAREFYMEYEPVLQDKSLYTYLKLSLAANIIDFGALENFDIKNTVKNVLENKPYINHYQTFIKKVKNSHSIIYLLDNAGEAYFDLLFLRKMVEEYQNIKTIALAAREEPFINDITLEDLRKGVFSDETSSYELVGLTVCKDKFLDYEEKGVFRDLFSKYDIIFSKGQGNYELFYKYKGIFFSLIVKCRPISDVLKVPIGDTVFYLSGEQAS